MMKSIRMGKAVKATRSFAPRSSARRSVAAKAFTVTLETPDGTQTIECPDDVVRSSLFYYLCSCFSSGCSFLLWVSLWVVLSCVLWVVVVMVVLLVCGFFGTTHGSVLYICVCVCVWVW